MITHTNNKKIASFATLLGVCILAFGCEKSEKDKKNLSLHSLEYGPIILDSAFPMPETGFISFEVRVHGNGIDALKKKVSYPNELRSGKFIFSLTIDNQGRQDIHYYFPKNQKPYLLGDLNGPLGKEVFPEKYTQPQLLPRRTSQTLTFGTDWVSIDEKVITTGNTGNRALVFIVNIEGRFYPVIATLNVD